jgi:L-amino acid N-acyltransferase YncA
MIEIRAVTNRDSEDIWRIWNEVIDDGNAFSSDASVPKAEVVEMWTKGDSYVAVLDGHIAGAYSLFPLHRGRQQHVADACYMVARAFRRKGIGALLAQHSLNEAKRKGFSAMQFNCVVSINEPALHLWKKLGFKIIGTVPQAFKHPRVGLVDTHIMHRFL